jgi:two-component system C4-dicarboxylate transport response regulator DctD
MGVEGSTVKGDGTRWVLLVEDDDDNREALLDFLADADYEAKGVAGGLAALNLLETSRPSLILSDYVLQDMDGRELRRRVRELLGVLAPPFVLLTGMARSDIKDISGTILLKPIDGEQLLSVVAQHYGDRQSQ